jgi:outer membrane immunogenic protein
MRSTLACSVIALSLFTAPAMADERPGIWTGLYIGGHAGYGWSAHDISVAHPCPACLPPLYQPDAFAGSGAVDSKGFIGGGQIGADKQFGPLVLGVALDVSKGTGEGSHTFRMDYDTDWAVQSKVDWFGSARARIGLANGPLLLYATGGVAWAKVSTSLQTISITGPMTMSELSSEAWHVGYVIGGGAEWALSPSISISAEYLRYEFGSADYDPKGLAYAGAPGEFKHHELAKGDPSIQVARGSLNFRF